jgi:YidC/Oxa1 family membrane protein insertase
MADRVKQLKERFGGNPKRLEKEINDLYLAEAPSLLRGMARGFLPVLLQMPVFMALYAAFTSRNMAGEQSLFGVPLEMHLIAATGPQLAVFAAALLLAAAIGFLSSRTARQQPGNRWLKLIYYTPVLSVAFLPLAASVYLVTSMGWTVVQTLALRQVLG